MSLPYDTGVVLRIALPMESPRMLDKLLNKFTKWIKDNTFGVWSIFDVENEIIYSQVVHHAVSFRFEKKSDLILFTLYWGNL